MATICPDRFAIPFDSDVVLNSGVTSDNYIELEFPYCSIQPIDVGDDEVGGLVISLHGTGGNAQKYLANAGDSEARVTTIAKKSLIVAPQFVNQSEASSIPANVLFWTGGRFWGSQSGSTNANPRSARIRSFAVLDRLLSYLCDPELYPKLSEIILVGHSGGGQLVNRYAASSQFEENVASPRGINVHYICLNPGNYLYLDDTRPQNGTLNQFQVPDPSANCPEYNEYGYGLESLWNYPNQVGESSILNNYRNRNMVYMLGSEDTKVGGNLPSSCQANLQGANRLERGIAYYNNLSQLYGAEISETQKLVIVPGVGHHGWGMMTSDAGVREIFGPMAAELIDFGELSFLTRAWNYLVYEAVELISSLGRLINSIFGRDPAPPDPSEW